MLLYGLAEFFKSCSLKLLLSFIITVIVKIVTETNILLINFFVEHTVSPSIFIFERRLFLTSANLKGPFKSFESSNAQTNVNTTESFHFGKH